ncbi:anti-sigma factor domain-containing protein [Oceanobacillus neutriphilus]|uniref:RsgI N-terminal anti-sigma domain-containing protein n=1 Tax=Oceanobacillus neutriphilus TaxID=531815 RepID=A0ABQ2NQS4_9BACI|nr:anti-sigma factor domain-containing protein [Oceanobacillus neutriphilus]GGP09493.1 hypothetical protein GCM10011346_13780 [Oceanobacillus neutriphilus]
MKKGIVMEIHRKYAILLSKNGNFEKGIILTEGAEIGAEVIFQPVYEKFGWKRCWEKSHRTVRLSAIFILALLLFGFPLYKTGLSDTETHAYVAIDINPSLELELNEDLIVTDVNALNESACELIDEVSSIQDEPITSVLASIVDESEDKGLADHKTMIVGISYENQDSKDEVITEITPYIESLPDWEVSTLIIPEEIREIAQNQDKSMNEIMALEMANGEEGEIEQVNDVTTDSEEDSAIIDFFYGEQEFDSEADRSMEQANPPEQQNNKYTDDTTDIDNDVKDDKKDRKTGIHQDVQEETGKDHSFTDDKMIQGLDNPSEMDINAEQKQYKETQEFEEKKEHKKQEDMLFAEKEENVFPKDSEENMSGYEQEQYDSQNGTQVVENKEDMNREQDDFPPVQEENTEPEMDTYTG